MDKEKAEEWSLIFEGITAAGVIAAALSLWLTYWGIAQEHNKDRRIQAAEQIKYAVSQLNDYRDDLYKYFPSISDDSRRSPLTADDAKLLFTACSDVVKVGTKPKFPCEARKVVGNLLNTLDVVAAFHWNQVAEREMIERAVGGVMIENYDFFEKFITHVSSVKQRQVFEDLTTVVRYIKQKKNIVGPGPDPTGR